MVRLRLECKGGRRGGPTIRQILDPVEPESVRPVFKDVFGQIQRGKGLEKFVFLGKNYLLSLDGTGYFTSETHHCPTAPQFVPHFLEAARI